MMSVPAPRATAVMAFGAFGVFWGAWGAALPQIQLSARVGNGALGVDLLLIGVGAMCSMRLAGGLADRLGPLVLPATMMALAATGLLPALAHSGVQLGAALFVLGSGSGAYDVAMNTAAARSEAAIGHPIMNLAHASFSLGVVATSLTVGVALDRGATPLGVFAACGVATTMVAGVLIGLRASAAPRPPASPPSAPVHLDAAAGAAVEPNGKPRMWLAIPRPLLILGGIGALSFFIEGAWQSWAAIHMERTFHGSPALGAAALAAFALAAAVGRLAGQRFTGRVTDRTLLSRGGALAAAGTFLAAAASSASMALIGVALAGLGTSICAPTVFSLTGRVAGAARRGAAMGTVTTIAYLGFVIGPAMVGVVTSAVGLRLALGVVGVVAIGLGLLARKAPVPSVHAG